MALHSLPLFIRLNGRPVIVLGDGDAAAAKRRLLERAGAVVTTNPDAVAMLAVVAMEGQANDDAAAAAAASLKARGLLVNVVDRPELCDFTTPAILDRDPVLIAIGTGGASAGLAKALRLLLETLFPPKLGALATAMFAARPQLRAIWPDAADRRRTIDAALAPGGDLDPLRSQSADAVGAWLASGGAPIDVRGRYPISLISDDPDDLTLRDARMLGLADEIRYGANVPAAILARARADARLVPIDDPDSTPDHRLTVWLVMAEPKVERAQ